MYFRGEKHKNTVYFRGEKYENTVYLLCVNTKILCICDVLTRKYCVFAMCQQENIVFLFCVAHYFCVITLC